MDLSVVFEKVALALGLGLLVGLQREHVQSQLAGIRTFALITVFGTVCALCESHFGGWIVAAGGLSVALLLVIANLTQTAAKDVDPGITTEVAALLMYAIGAYLVIGHVAVALVLSGSTALLLHWKAPLHHFVHRIGENDLKAIMRFVLIVLVIWPALPDEGYGPYGVFNPNKIWLMVVLIVGISLVGYVAQKWLGAQTGTMLAGVLGGLISSTATTVSYARRANEPSPVLPLIAAVLMVATTVADMRVLVEIAVVAPRSFPVLAPPLVALLAWMALIAAAMYLLAQKELVELPVQDNPAELTSALIFGILYAGVTLGVTAVKDWFGQSALYGVAILSGLHDLDAITLSTAQLVDREEIDAALGWRLIVTATLANLIVKAGIVAALAHRHLLGWVGLLFGVMAVGGLLLLFFWPGS